MGKIIQLDNHLSNMIAAGEVVERPSSVVKELVENSIDALSTKIIINLLESGTKRIEVIDNGTGMSIDDAKMCFHRHATSKIKNEYDLFRINTLGFRGEAIPSIASVSKMTLITDNGEGGYLIEYKAGSKVKEEVSPANKGTTITVSDLFFNTPARLKYIKSLPSELQNMAGLITNFAISRPDISFTLTNDNKEILNVSGKNDLIRLFGELYGFETAKNIIETSYEGYGYKIKFVLVKPMITRSNRNSMITIVNKRYVKSYSLMDSIKEAYASFIPQTRYPIATIYLDIDPLLIDVNVHPTKMQIKISNEEELKEIVSNTIKNAILKCQLIPEIKEEEPVQNNYYQKQSFFVEDVTPVNKETITLNEDVTKYDEKIKSDIEASQSNDDDIQETSRLPYLEYVGQVHGTYLIFQNETGMFLVDQHAAAERINYEKYYEILKHPDNVLVPLLIPYNMEFNKQDMLFIDEHINDFLAIGISLQASGENSYFVREVPAWIDFDNIEDFIRNLINSFVKNKSINIIKNRDAIAKQIACKSSIKANHALTNEEILKLIETLNKCKNPYNCPHGRPTIVKISTLDLEKMFKRVM